MMLRKVIRMFEDGNVCVTGLRGTGKDMLTANVVVRRKKPYVSNVEYGGTAFPFDPKLLDCGRNTFQNFLDGKVRYYSFPYPDGTDVYISDVGVYFPSHYHGELNKHYGHFPNFMALSRQLGECNVHINVQNLNRAWDKIREQSDQYILCRWCKVFFGKIVIQKIRIYELYDSCVRRVPPFRLSAPIFSASRRDTYKIERDKYEQNYGVVKEGILIYINKSNYDTRIFKKILEGGRKDDKADPGAAKLPHGAGSSDLSGVGF